MDWLLRIPVGNGLFALERSGEAEQMLDDAKGSISTGLDSIIIPDA